MKLRHCYNAYFRWSAGLLQRKVQGFLANEPENLAPEQSHLALKALDFKAIGFVKYALSTHYNKLLARKTREPEQGRIPRDLRSGAWRQNGEIHERHYTFKAGGDSPQGPQPQEF